MGILGKAGERVSAAAEQIRDGLADRMGLVVGLLGAAVVLLAGILGVMLWRGAPAQ